MFCIVIDPEAASFPAIPKAFIPNCSYNKEPKRKYNIPLEGCISQIYHKKQTPVFTNLQVFVK